MEIAILVHYLGNIKKEKNCTCLVNMQHVDAVAPIFCTNILNTWLTKSADAEPATTQGWLCCVNFNIIKLE